MEMVIEFWSKVKYCQNKINNEDYEHQIRDSFSKFSSTIISFIIDKNQIIFVNEIFRVEK